TVLLGKYHRVAQDVATGTPQGTSSVLASPSSLVVTVVTSMPRVAKACSISTIARLGPPWTAETDGMTCNTFIQRELSQRQFEDIILVECIDSLAGSGNFESDAGVQASHSAIHLREGQPNGGMDFLS